MASPALIAVDRLLRLIPVLEDGDADQQWLADRLSQYLADASRGLTIETALNLVPMPGQANWWTEAAIEARDIALRELAARFYPERRPASQAYQIERQALRYATSAWRFDRDQPEMPERYASTEAECLWVAFKSGATMPLSKRQLQSILAAERSRDAA